MSDILKKLKSVFVVEDAAGAKPAAPAPQPAAPAPSYNGVSKNSQSSNGYATPATRNDGTANDKFTEILNKAMDDANPQGFDYYEFRQSLQNLAKMPMDDSLRYQSAYAMAQTMGATAEGLINSALEYMNVLKREESRFQDAAVNQRRQQVGAKEADLQNLTAAIAQKQQTIKQLTEEIAQAQTQLDQVKRDIQESTQKVEKAQADFNASLRALTDQINRDVVNMKNYIK